MSDTERYNLRSVVTESALAVGFFVLTTMIVGGLFYALMWVLVNIQAMAGGL